MINKKELVKAVAERLTASEETVVTQTTTVKFVDAIFDVLTESLVQGEEVKITGFGSFSIAERGERVGRNPSTGESMVIRSSKAPKFKAAKALKDMLNN